MWMIHLPEKLEWFGFFFFIGKYGKDKPDKSSQTGEALPLGNPNNFQG